MLKSKRNTGYLIYSILLINILFDVFSYVYGRGSVFAYVRGFLIFSLLAILFFQNSRQNKSFRIILFIAVYWIILVYFSSEFERSFKAYYKIIFPLLLLPVSFAAVKEMKDLTQALSSIIIIMIISLAYAVLSNLFGIGDTSYMKKELAYSIGFGHGKLYASAIALTLIPALIQWSNFSKRQRVSLLVIGGLTLLYLILSMRRTTLIIVVIGFFSYYYYTNKITRLFRILIIFGGLIFFTFPLWEDAFFQRFNLRSAKIFSSEYDVQEEARFMEFSYVISDLKKEKAWIFGKELFNSPGNYGFPSNRRMIHVDYTRIFHGSGFVGIFLYLFLYLTLFKLTYKYKSNNYLFSLTITLVYLSFFISFSGQMYELTFRSLLFSLIGASLKISYLNKHMRNHKIIENINNT